MRSRGSRISCFMSTTPIGTAKPIRRSPVKIRTTASGFQTRFCRARKRRRLAPQTPNERQGVQDHQGQRSVGPDCVGCMDLRGSRNAVRYHHQRMAYLPGGQPDQCVQPCSEYMFLDDTACNLASLNLTKFYSADGQFELEHFRHAVRLWTIALEISVLMASFPSRSIAERAINSGRLGWGMPISAPSSCGWGFL